jgi:hypothetical protein
VRATFLELDTLTIASMLPGIHAHYLAPLFTMECCITQVKTDYVKLTPR